MRQAALGYPGAGVLQGVDLTLGTGDYVALLGGNGSGKTTLVRTLLGVLDPLSGAIERSPALRLGYVPQQAALDPLFPITALEVVELGLLRDAGLLRPLAAAARERALDALARMHLGEQRRKLYGQLSGGQQRRVLVARALASDPNFLLLDEPTAGVDARATDIILQALGELHARGCGVLIVTHLPLALRGRANGALLCAHGQVLRRAPERLLSPEGVLEVFQ